MWRSKLEISPGFWLLLLCGVLIGTPELTFSVLSAAALHEAGHLLLLRRFRVPAERLRLSLSGAEITAQGAQRLPYGQEILILLAGPAVNAVFSLLLAEAARELNWQAGYLYSGANALLGIYNLLPIVPLDGGQILSLAVAWRFGPLIGDAVGAVVGVGTSALLLLLAAFLTFRLNGGWLFLLSAIFLFFRAAPQLRLAKNAVRV